MILPSEVCIYIDSKIFDWVDLMKLYTINFYF